MSSKKSTRPGDKRDTRDKRPGFEIPPFTLEGWEAPALAPLPDLAEERAQHRLLEARQLREKTGRPTAQTKALEDAAERWRDLAGLSEADAGPLAAMWQQVATEAIAGLLIRAGGKSEDAIGYLVTLAAQALDGLRGLAAGGDVKAGGALMMALETAATDFETLAWHKPEVFRARARNSFAIPGTISQNADKAEGNAGFAALLEVGEDFPIKTTPKGGATWQHGTKSNALAVRLVSYVEHVRQMTGILGAPSPAPEWLEDALALEALAPDTYPEWEAVAWRVLDNGKHPLLHDKKTRICEPATRGSKQGLPGAAKVYPGEARKALKHAFRTISTGTARVK